jgi:hypothetical protein
MPLSTNADAPLTISVSVEQLAAKLPAEESLRVARALIVAAVAIIPKESPRDDLVAPQALELAIFLNAAVTSLLCTAAERRRVECFGAICERQEAVGAHGLLN